MSSSGRSFGKKEVDKTQLPKDINNTFFGRAIPDEVRVLIPLLHRDSSSVEIVRTCIQKVVLYLCDNSVFSGASGTEAYKKYQREQSSSCTGDEINILFTGIYSILAAAVSSKTSTDVIVADLKVCYVVCLEGHISVM